ncbi:MAG: hypothetical protein WC048_19105 [Rhizobium sp.]
MRQQPKPFIVEIKPSRRVKTDTGKPSIWGKLNLSVEPDPQVQAVASDEPAVFVENGRR